jgi:hypothetical protein
VIHRKLSLIFVANSVEWNSLHDTKTLDTGNFLGSPPSCLMDFHQEAVFYLICKKGTPKTVISPVNFISQCFVNRRVFGHCLLSLLD